MLPLPEIFAALRWWAVLMLLGAVATPLAHMLFKPLADRGYAFSKMLGLLLVSYLFWILGSLGFLGNNVGGIIVALLAVTGLSSWAVWQTGVEPLRQWLRENRRQILLTELVFTAVFLLWVFVRAQNPAIAATEKPMEFAFLNAVGRSPSFPPLDPWLSGFAISYYYFGYVMTSVIARLAFVPETIAFNLGLAWLVAGTAVGAFGLVYNLIAAAGRTRQAQILGLIAALALPLAGNMVIALEVAHGNNIGSDSFWQWLDVRDLNGPATDSPRYESGGWWWWRTSRVIHEYHLSGRAETGLEPIVEVPAFSFILGDMHPHVLALPFALLSLTVALAWYLEARKLEIRDQRLEEGSPQSLISNLQSLLPNIPLYLATALVLGGLSFLNTWDVLIHLFVVIGAYLVGRWQTEGWHSQLVSQSLTVAVLLVIPAILLYLPFYIGFRSQAGAPYLLPMLMRPTRLAQFLVIFGMPLFSIVILLVVLGVKQRFRQWRAGLGTAVSLLAVLLFLMLFLGWIIASSAEGSGRVIALADELGIGLTARPNQPFAFGWGLTAVFALIPTILTAKITYSGVTILLSLIIALIVMIWSGVTQTSLPAESQASDETSAIPMVQSITLPFTLLLILTAALLTLGPEFVYLRDNFGQRLNTMFKFYYQAWLLFGIAGIVSIDYLWQMSRRQISVITPAVVSGGYAIALTLALLFPYFGVQSRAVEYRGPVDAAERQPATLNGLAQIGRFNPDELAAISWLREEAEGTPVVLEAIGGQYSAFARVSANTGLPTVLGWAGHEYQWRGSSTTEPSRRDPLVRDIYSQLSLEDAAPLLDEFGVEYIYVGHLERDTYGTNGLEKFAQQLEVAFQSNSVTIYRWQPN
ncbi:MAG: DUF2298 domain-containing protein [Chloroflexota bacterium]